MARAKAGALEIARAGNRRRRSNTPAFATVHRIGKHIVFDLDRVKRAPCPGTAGRAETGDNFDGQAPRDGQNAQPQLIVHLGMSGRLQVCDQRSEVVKHTHAILKLESGRELRFVDPRRFGRLSVAAAGNFEARGIEPLEVELEQIHPVVSRPQETHQNRIAQPETVARRRKHLCR